MKQSELDKLSNAAKRESAKKHGWKSSRGFLFTSTDFLFLTLGIIALNRSSNLNFTAYCKPLSFDDLFWQIVCLKENSKKPLSFRAAGVWTAPMSEFIRGHLPISGFTNQELIDGIDRVFQTCHLKLEQVAEQVCSITSYMDLVEEAHTELLEQYPDAAKNIWVERLLAAILENDIGQARDIIRDRKAADDSGGFVVGPGWKTFYDLADEYLNRIT